MMPVPEDIKYQIEGAYRDIGLDASCGTMFRVKQARPLR